MSTGHMPSWKSKRSMDSFVSSGTPWTWVRIDMQLKSRNSGDSKCRHNESEGPRDVHENKSVLQGRIGHTAVCSSASDTCFYVWGGVRETARGSQYMDDLHRFDTRTRCWEWIRTRGDRPCARAFHTTIMYQGNMYIFGGCNGKGRFNRVFCINPQTGVSNLLATSGDTPATRYCHTGVLYRHLMIVFGGKCGGRNSNKRLADMFSFNLCENIWTAVDQLGDVPNSRSAHVSVVCGHKMLMFGGRNAAGDCCPELFEFDLQTNMWCRIFSNEPLFTRARHSAVAHNECLIVFGGWNGRKKMNDLFVLRLVNRAFELIVENNEWATCAPCRRECHTAVVCNHQMYICCGRFRDTFLNDVCALSLPGKTLKEVVRDHILNDKVSLNFNRFGISQSLVNYLAEYSNSGLLDIPSTSTQAQFVALARAPSDTHSALIKEIDNLCCSPQSMSNRIFSNSQVHSRNSAVHSDGDHDVELCEELNQDDERSSSVD